jgi:antibiotic biosynthesis monooxygenase (ABM) superfamily enzyme
MWHFPLIFGIVLYAVTAEEVVSHPDSRLSSSGQWIFALAITLTVYSLIAVVRRAGGPLLWERGIAGLVVIGIALVVPVTGWVVVALFVAAMVVAQIVEGRRLADRINTDA